MLLIEKEAVIHAIASSLARTILLDEAERVEVHCNIRISYVIIIIQLAEIDVDLNTVLNDSNAVSKLNTSINSNAIIFIMR